MVEFGNQTMLEQHLIQFLMNIVNLLELLKSTLMILTIQYMLEQEKHGLEIVFQLEMAYINQMMEETIGKKLD